MHAYFKISLIVNFCCYKSVSVEVHSNFRNEANKIYISSTDIILDQSQIFVILDNALFTVDSIQVDNNGFFVENPLVLEPHYCIHCGAMETNITLCWNCKKNPRK